MYPAFTSAVAVLLLAQNLSGACWQRVSQCACEIPTSAAHAERCCQHEQNGNASWPESGGGRHCKLKCCGICTYVPQQKTHLDVKVLLSSGDFIKSVASLLVANHSTALGGTKSCELLPTAPPERLHLLHQIMLI